MEKPGWPRPSRFTHILLQLDFQLADDSGAAGAETLGIGLFGVHPAAGALFTLGFADTDGQFGEVHTDANLGTFLGSGPVTGGDDADLGQIQAFAGGLQRSIFGG